MDRPVDIAAQGVRAAADVISGLDQGRVEFVLLGETLQGKTSFVIAADAVVTLTFSLPGGNSEQVRFRLGSQVRQKH